jgi:uncharacterized damage-inducible protein DinB
MSSVVEPHDPRFPVGRHVPPDPITIDDRRYAILSIAEMPEQMREAVRKLNFDQLNTPYREGGWTVRQVVHHVADSHSTALHRFKRALTEDNPEIAGYDQDAFALLPDTHGPTEWSLELIESVHARWVLLMQSMTDEQFGRTYRHAERGLQTLDQVTLLYGWHARHHVAHITHLRARKGW